MIEENLQPRRWTDMKKSLWFPVVVPIEFRSHPRLFIGITPELPKDTGIHSHSNQGSIHLDLRVAQLPWLWRVFKQPDKGAEMSQRRYYLSTVRRQCRSRSKLRAHKIGLRASQFDSTALHPQTKNQIERFRAWVDHAVWKTRLLYRPTSDQTTRLFYLPSNERCSHYGLP